MGVVPLLLRGLREKSIATKRQSAVIIENMSKLVDDPLDAAPFLPLLLPALEKNAATISDPEARDVSQRAVDQLKRLKGLADKAISVRGDISKLDEAIKKALPEQMELSYGQDKVVKHISMIATCLMDLHFMEDVQWKKNISNHMKAFTEDDDDAEELCNCQFTLAYGTKILLHNTKMKLKR